MGHGGYGGWAETWQQGQEGQGPCETSTLTRGSLSPAELSSKLPPPPLRRPPPRVQQWGGSAGRSPGHRWALHCRYSSCGPRQAAPPKKGPKQARSRRCVPPPHVTLQPPHGVQACHFPSTVGHGHAQSHEDGGEEGADTGTHRQEATRRKKARPRAGKPEPRLIQDQTSASCALVPHGHPPPPPTPPGPCTRAHQEPPEVSPLPSGSHPPDPPTRRPWSMALTWTLLQEAVSRFHPVALALGAPVRRPVALACALLPALRAAGGARAPA